MEKFGIFDLLDALSAIAGTPYESAQTKSGENRTDNPTEKPLAEDSAFRAPDYGMTQNSGSPFGGAESEKNTAEIEKKAVVEEQNALETFLNRHSAIANRIDGKHD